jgi:hypothetical protein
MAPRLIRLTVASLAALAIHHAGPAQAQYDNPTMGETPCVVLSHYVTDQRIGQAPIDSLNPPVQTAEAAVANVCGRSVEVELCINYVDPAEGDGAQCFTGFLRPWSRTDIQTVAAPVRFTGPTWNWRWVSGDAGM